MDSEILDQLTNLGEMSILNSQTQKWSQKECRHQNK